MYITKRLEWTIGAISIIAALTYVMLTLPWCLKQWLGDDSILYLYLCIPEEYMHKWILSIITIIGGFWILYERRKNARITFILLFIAISLSVIYEEVFHIGLRLGFILDVIIPILVSIVGIIYFVRFYHWQNGNSTKRP